MKQKPFKTILDELEEEFKGEISERAHIARFENNGPIKFDNLQEKYKNKLETYNQKVKNSLSVIGKNNDRINEPELESDNKNLRLPASSTIQSAAYWIEKEYLLVSFKSGHTYSYQKVPISRILIWEQAPSAGSYFYYNIRMSYKYQKMG